MSWNKVAVVGAGLIKFGELFEQSYEQMAAGAFDAALANVDKGLDRRAIDAAIVATQRGTLWGQEGIGGNTVPSALGHLRHPLHPGGERLSHRIRRLPDRGHGGGQRRPRRGSRHRGGEDAGQVGPGGSAVAGRLRPPALHPGRDGPRALRPLRHPAHARVRDHPRDAGLGGGQEPPQRLPRPLRPLPERDHRRPGPGLGARSAARCACSTAAPRPTGPPPSS